MVANFTQQFPNKSGRNSPCPICRRIKDQDCKWNDEVILCHSERDGRGYLDGYVYKGLSKDKNGGDWGIYAKERQKKPIRAKARKDFYYTDRNGNPLVKVTREDDGQGRKKFYQSHWDGKTWVIGLTEEVKKSVPIYRYQEVRQAIANEQPIFMVEGEGVADILWGLGIPATTSLGGSGKFRTYGNYSQDLVSASLIFAPDRDQCGLAHMEDIACDFPDAQWCYAFPDSPLWERVSKNGGADLADWINDGATAVDIMGAVGAKRELKQFQPDNSRSKNNNNVIEHPTVNREVYTNEEVREKIEQLISHGVLGSQLELEIADLARYSSYSVPITRDIYKARLREIERLEAREDVGLELTKLINANNTSVNIYEILPAQLAQPINQLATCLNLKPETYLTTFLTTTSSLFKVGTRIAVCPATDWEETPQLYAGIVAPSSQKKSPILRAIATKPLQKLQQEAKQAFENALANYNERIEEWDNCKDRSERASLFPDGKPQQPKLKHYSFTQGTTEGLLRQLQNHPDKGILWNCDELAGLFKGANQYKSGKGDDIEAILSMYDGTPMNLLRADESKNITLDGCILSIIGTTQPTVLQSLMKDDTDGNGQWARFCWVQQPLALCTLPESGKIELTPLLVDIYQKVDSLPPTVYRLSADGWKLFHKEHTQLDLKRIETASKSSGLSSCYGKAQGRLARLCLNLHAIWELSNGNASSEEVSAEIVKKAIALNRFYLAQVTSLYSEFHQDSLAPHLLKIIQLSERKGWIKAKDVQVSTTAKHRPTALDVRIWFNELASLGKGITQGEGRNIQFNYKVDKVDELVDKSSTSETVENTLLQVKVDKVDEVDDFQFSPSINSQSYGLGTFSGQVDTPTKTSTFVESSTLSTNPCSQDLVNDVAVDSSSTIPSTFVESSTETTAQQLDVIATELETPPIEVGDTVRVKRDGDCIKAGEVGIAVKYTDFDKSFKVKVGDRQEGFYAEQLEVMAQ